MSAIKKSFFYLRKLILLVLYGTKTILASVDSMLSKSRRRFNNN